MKKQKKIIRVGVVGIGQGRSFMRGSIEHIGMKLVAICDTWKEKLKEVNTEFNVTTYTDYNKFLEHDMDAVVLANYFHEHTPFAIKALDAGKHVMSECICNATLAEGVALCRKVEKTGLIYMFAENYPFTVFNMEMRRLYQNNEIGEVTYAEGEYNHPWDPKELSLLAPGFDHWRNWIPPTYYCTHALAPLMYITNRWPVKVNALSIARPEIYSFSVRRSDPGSIILCRMDNGAVFRLFGLILPGHSNWYRVHGTTGAMENTRGPGYFGTGQVRVWHEPWYLKNGQVTEQIYVPEWPEQGDLARKMGHGGGDFWTNYEFAKAIKTNQQPFLDVYRGVTMASVGILAWRSALQDGTPITIPDFRKEEERKQYENDNISPFPSHIKAGYPSIQPSILGTVKPTKQGIAIAKKNWRKIGYSC